MNLFRTGALFLILSATPLSEAQTANNVAAQAMAQARSVIAGMVQANSRLTPEFIRMGFHDCIGGCDGCIDLSNPDNNGLANPISVLDPVVQQFANANTLLSRADIWALAAMVGADVANHGQITQPINFTQNWFGRVDCENANSVCHNAQGQTVPCSATAGPSRATPKPTFDSDLVFSYFATNFGFDERQTVTIMGAHTVGHLVKNESGINGPNGWVINNAILHNEYYNALMGAATASTPLNQIEANSPNWVRTFENNTGNNGLVSLNRWQLDVAGLSLVMLDSDISLVRDLNASNTDTTTGAVSCFFNPQTGSPSCPVRSTASIAAEFSDNNDLWLSEFKAVLDLVLSNGYNRIPCTSAVCPLTTSRIGPVSAPVAPTLPPTPSPVATPPVAPVHYAPSIYMQPVPPPTPQPTPRPTQPIYNHPESNMCISQGQGCSWNTNGCCAGSTCVGNWWSWWSKTCQPQPAPVAPTPSPVAAPAACISDWQGCSWNTNGCCAGSTCVGNWWSWSKTCQPQPAPAPTPSPMAEQPGCVPLWGDCTSNDKCCQGSCQGWWSKQCMRDS